MIHVIQVAAGIVVVALCFGLFGAVVCALLGGPDRAQPLQRRLHRPEALEQGSIHPTTTRPPKAGDFKGRGMMALAALSLMTPTPSSTEYDVLPTGWRADIGIPVPWNDTTIWLYGDTWTDNEFIRNTVVVDGEAIETALPNTAGGTHYWPGDGVELPDGRLLVVMGEVRDLENPTDEQRAMGMGFEGVDGDAFLVTDPTNPMSWRLATKIEEGSWGDAEVQFSDQWPFAFLREPRSFTTTMWQYDPVDPAAPWVQLDVSLPESFGTFAPIQTSNGWWGVTMSDWTTGAFWWASDVTGQWRQMDTFTTDGRTYQHGLNIIDGRVIWRWSNGEGSMRPEYRDITDSLTQPSR